MNVSISIIVLLIFRCFAIPTLNLFIVERINTQIDNNITSLYSAAAFIAIEKINKLRLLGNNSLNVTFVNLTNVEDESNVIAQYLGSSHNSGTYDGVIGLRLPFCSVMPYIGTAKNILIISHTCDCDIIAANYMHSLPCAKEVANVIYALLKYFAITSLGIVSFHDMIDSNYNSVLASSLKKYNINIFIETSPPILDYNNERSWNTSSFDKLRLIITTMLSKTKG